MNEGKGNIINGRKGKNKGNVQMREEKRNGKEAN